MQPPLTLGGQFFIPFSLAPARVESAAEAEVRRRAEQGATTDLVSLS